MGILKIFWKDCLIMMRDRGTIINLFVLPLMFSSVLTLALGGVFGGGESGDSGAMKIPVVVEGANSKAMLEQLKSIKGVEWEMKTLQDAQQLIKDNKALGALAMADDSSAGVQATYYSNPTQLSSSRLVLGQIQALFAAVNREQLNMIYAAALQKSNGSSPDDVAKQAGVAGPVQVKENVVTANKDKSKEPTSAEQYFPGFTVAFLFFITATIAQYVFLEKDLGTMNRLLTSSVRRYAILIGKLMPHFAVGFIQVVVIFAAGHFLFGLRLPNLPALAAVTVFSVVAAVGLGIMITSLSKSQPQASGIATLLTFTMATLGGCYVPLFFMPSFMQSVAKLTPQGWAMSAYQDILLKGDGLVQVLPAIGVLAGFGLVFYLIGLFRFKFQS